MTCPSCGHRNEGLSDSRMREIEEKVFRFHSDPHSKDINSVLTDHSVEENLYAQALWRGIQIQQRVERTRRPVVIEVAS